MLDIGWQELLVIGALALIVVGPKDLPGLLRTCGQWVGKVRGMAREFQRSMNDAAREADISNFKELRDLKNDISGNLDFKAQAAKAQSFLDGPGDDAKAKPAAAKDDAKAKPAAAKTDKAPAADAADAPAEAKPVEAKPAETKTADAVPPDTQEPDAKATGT